MPTKIVGQIFKFKAQEYSEVDLKFKGGILIPFFNSINHKGVRYLSKKPIKIYACTFSNKS